MLCESEPVLSIGVGKSTGLRAAVFSRGIEKIAHLQEFFPFNEIAYRTSDHDAERVDVLLTWGNKKTGKSARRYAQRHKKPVWSIEDGFFRSLYPGAGNPPLSLVLDDLGIYYDARRPSRLERLIHTPDGPAGWDTPAARQLVTRAELLLTLIQRHGLSKYNNGRARIDLSPTRAERILVVDQTRGDASIAGGLADEARFSQMLESLLSEYPRAEILIKVHPEVLAGKKAGCIDARFLRAKNVKRLLVNYGPHELLGCVDHVVTVSSQFGFDALCAKKSVTCFGAPFYAGWGLTEDRIEVPRRGQPRSLPELAAAALLLYPSYVDPVTGTRCSPERALHHLGLQRSMAKANEGHTLAVGFSAWKRPYVKPFLEGPHAKISFVNESELPKRLRRDNPDRVIVWGQRISAESRAVVESHRVPLVCMEDGFLRSNALGSDLTPPLSVVLDDQGIYYDPHRPSVLENLLQNHPFTDEERAWSRGLIATITSQRLSKYNVQDDAPLNFPSRNDKPVHLIIGQVDDDASVKLGSQEVRSSEQLLRRVRQEHPNGYLVYKPHPDVISGNRPGRLSKEAENLADWLETSGSIAACLDVATTVHTMTSLVGFEALLRGLVVTTYGLPFYAGWGLTRDTLTCDRRTRSLQLEELVYVTLALYPRYYSQDTGCFLNANQASLELARDRDAFGRGTAHPSLVRKVRRLSRYLRGLMSRA